MAPQEIDLIPFFFIILSFVSCSLQDIPLNKYVEEASQFGSQAYPSYFDMIDDGGNFSQDLIKQSSDVLSLKSFDKVDGTSASVNVNDFGAEGDGETDDTEAFEKAWKVACSSNDEAVLVVPEKIYHLKPIQFSGPCKSEVTVQILGTLKASDNRSDFSQDGRHWLVFDTVRNLLVEGGGVINGNGEQWWQNSCKINKSKPCKDAPTALIFQKCKNLRVNNMNIQDAQQIHLSFQKCMNVQASNLSIIAPEKSPNTDGIHVTDAQNILITNSVIATGDDCLSIVNGCKKVQATNITCGPGHGISIGGLGSGNSKAYVSEITVNGAVLSGTTNGVRIKTWQGGSGSASNITFENIEMHNVSNPIIIDQNYCDRKPCKEQRSAVQVENVVYKNISGTSASDVAIKFDCSKSFPCKGIVLQGINLQREGGKAAKALCNHVNVNSIGEVSPLCHYTVLLDAEEKQAHNKELRSWLQQLKDVFLDAEDLLDEFECQALRKQTYHGTTRKVCRFFSPSNPIAYSLKAGHEIKGIRERLDELKANKAIFDLLSIDHHGRNQDDHHSSVKNMMMRENMTHSFVRPSEVIGRDSEKKEIVDLLLQQGDNQSGNNKNVSVIPIVGIGGLGKTTLAKLLYNDERVVRNFELRMWVYVSVDFDIIRLTKEILSSALDTEISDKLSIDQLQGKLRDALKDKKFLLVLDDVWIDDRIKWSEFRDVLIDGAKLGSKILVTTRNISVASVTSTVRTYVNLKGLSNEDCLSLFVKCAFVEEEEKKHPNLFEIGKDIVKKCGGVPLAVRTLGSQLYLETDERKWKLIRDSEIWELEREGAGHILPALRLSYTQLPSHLKNCLAYCLLLPKGTFGYYSLDLIYCWMAHGILQPRDHENLELEDVGELYFKELWARSFFEHVELVDYHYNLSFRFSMHDLIHDLVQSLAEGEFSIVNSSTKNISENVRHLPILELGQNGSTMLRKLNKVRTITARGIIIDESFLHTCLSIFKYLRMLGLFDLSLKGLPSSIGTLKHLRYLDLAGNDEIKKLPNTICKLQSLQSLGLLGCENLENLPRDTSNLTCLRLLFLTTKQTSFSENGVGCLKSLRFLCIWNCRNLTSLPSDMSYLAALRTLVIYKCKRLELVNGNYQVIALRLQKLVIDGVPKMLALPEWLQGAAETLQDCYIIHSDNLEALPGWLTNFTSLRKLVLESCWKLLYLPEKVHPLELTIENCPKLERRC